MIERTHQRDFWTTATAVFSDCGLYRYRLKIKWDESRQIVPVIGLNPSTATEFENDPTIERLERWARRNGYGALSMYNAYAFRSTDPKKLWEISDPIGPENDFFLRSEFCRTRVSPIAAWGANIDPTRSNILREMARRCEVSFLCWGLTKSGHPKHPLYLSNDVLDNPRFADLSIPVEVV